MVRYFFEGGPWFMGTLSILFLIMLAITVMAAILVFKSSSAHSNKINRLIGHIKSIALFTLVFGIFGQILGLVDIFDYLANQNSDLAPTILITAIKISCYSTIYGIIIYLVSLVITLALKLKVNAHQQV